MAYQTLQGEMTSLLQKLERDKVRGQTIEKKSAVAEKEVNELTTRNEELMEQLKVLETQLEEAEKKREAEQTKAQQDKEQWGRMLELSGRLHAQADAERKRLLEEKKASEERATQSKGMTSQPAEEGARRQSEAQGELSRIQQEAVKPEASRDGSSRTTISFPAGPGRGLPGRPDVAQVVPSLRGEVRELTDRVQLLRSALERTKQHYEGLHARTREFLEANDEFNSHIDQVLEDDRIKTKPAIVSNGAGGRNPAHSRSWQAGMDMPQPMLASVGSGECY